MYSALTVAKQSKDRNRKANTTAITQKFLPRYVKDVKRKSQAPFFHMMHKRKRARASSPCWTEGGYYQQGVSGVSLCVGYGVYCPPGYCARHKTWNLHTSDWHWVSILSKQTRFPEHNPLGTLSKHDRYWAGGTGLGGGGSSTRWGWKQRGLGVQGQSQLYTESEISLSYMRFCLKTNFKKYWQDGLSDKTLNELAPQETGRLIHKALPLLSSSMES